MNASVLQNSWIALQILAVIQCSAAAAETTYQGERHVTFHGAKFRVVEAQPSEVQLFWRNPETGKPFRQFRSLQDFLTSRGERIRFIMNGGLFEEDGSPCGLLIENRKLLRPLKT